MKALQILFAIVLAGTVPLSAQQKRVPLRAEAVLERWEKMTPEEREKALARLPPERRARVEERLKRLESMPAGERDNLRQRYQEFQSLPQGRRDALRLEIQALRSMRPILRRRRVNSPEFQRLYSPEEQKLLREALGF